MKILITSTGSWGTGSFMVIEALIHEFLQLGHKVKVFFPDSGPTAQPYYNNDIYDIWHFPIKGDGVEIETFPLMIPDPHPRNPSGLTFKDLSEQQLRLYMDEFKEKIKAVIAEFQPDVIECQHVWLMAYVISELGLPYIVTAHNSDQMGYEFDPRMRKFAANAAKNAKYIFSISNMVSNKAQELYKVDRNKIILLPNGYDKTVFKRLVVNRKKLLQQLQLDIPVDATIVTFAGKLSATKGVDIILAANELLQNTNIHFLLFGAGDIKNVGATGGSPTRVASTLERIHLLGHQPPEIIARAHNVAKLSIMPSRVEGFGIAGLEAMGCGLPIVTTKGTGAESFAVGEIITPEDPQQLADAILAIVNLAEDAYQELSVKAEQAAQNFSWETIAKKRLHYYQKLQRYIV